MNETSAIGLKETAITKSVTTHSLSLSKQAFIVMADQDEQTTQVGKANLAPWTMPPPMATTMDFWEK